MEIKDPERTILCAVVNDGELALVRVMGKGSFGNSLAVKKFASHACTQPQCRNFIIDLRYCETMDSTFMGVLAGVCLEQKKRGLGKMVVLNCNDQCRRLLRNLGLTHLIDMRETSMPAFNGNEGALKPAVANGQVSKLEQICLTLQAHKDLVQADEQNEVRFQAVIEYLEQSYEQENQKRSEPGA